MEITLKPIGYVESAVKEGKDQGWGQEVSEIRLDAALAAGLQGIEQFSHIVVLFYMHQSSYEQTTDLVRRPQGREDMPEVGIFAQRAKHRPNPIGSTAVRLLAVKGNVLRVAGLDAINGTPVIDIKPYFASFDQRDNHTEAPWVKPLMQGYFAGDTGTAADAGTDKDRVKWSVSAIDHVQVSAPAGCETDARKFYGEVLGLTEVPKPAELQKRGGAWFQCGKQQIHVGIEAAFSPAKKAHPAFLVNGLEGLQQRLREYGIPFQEDFLVPGVNRIHAEDPYGNRLEFMEWQE